MKCHDKKKKQNIRKFPQSNKRYLFKKPVMVNGERLRAFCLAKHHSHSTLYWKF